MKKYILGLMLMTMLALTVSACGGKKTGTAKSTEETNPENGLPLSKQPDANAPVLSSIVIYVKGADGKLEQVMEAADTMTEENVLALLAKYGTISETTGFVSLTTEETEETLPAGPGTSFGGAAAKRGVLTLSGFAPGEGFTEEEAKQAVRDSFALNFQLLEVELVLQ